MYSQLRPTVIRGWKSLKDEENRGKSDAMGPH